MFHWKAQVLNFYKSLLNLFAEMSILWITKKKDISENKKTFDYSPSARWLIVDINARFIRPQNRSLMGFCVTFP